MECPAGNFPPVVCAIISLRARAKTLRQRVHMLKSSELDQSKGSVSTAVVGAIVPYRSSTWLLDSFLI